jgi:hypothetical protein
MPPAQIARKQAEKRLQRALAPHQQGKLAEAEQLYRDIQRKWLGVDAKKPICR